MPASSITATANANGMGYSAAVEKSQVGDVQSILARFFKDRFGRHRKAWTTVCELLKVEEHTAKHRLAGRRYFSADDLAALLRGDLGGEVLDLLMGDARPPWYAKYQRQQQLGTVRREIERQRKLLERLEQGAAE
jgi:hypothetical protein